LVPVALENSHGNHALRFDRSDHLLYHTRNDSTKNERPAQWPAHNSMA
jgi:hypothetical protein